MRTAETYEQAVKKFNARVSKLGVTVIQPPYETPGGERGSYVRALVLHPDGIARHWYARHSYVVDGVVWKWFTGDPQHRTDR